MYRRLKRAVICFIGMLGLRLDQAAFTATFLAWVLVFGLSLAAYGTVFIWGGLDDAALRRLAVGYAIVIWLVYYGGLSVVLGTRVRRWMIDLWGKENATRGFNAVLGIVFLHQALAQGAAMDAYAGTIAQVPGWMTFLAGASLVLVGGTVKLWATYASSLDTYYYNDMFRGEPTEPDSTAYEHGPFRWFKNPMYGVGNLQGYGSALVVASWPGLLIAGVFHATIYAFYYLFERSFVSRTYRLSNQAPAAASSTTG